MFECAGTKFRFRIQLFSLTLFVTTLCQLSLAASDPLRYQNGLRNSPGERRLNPKQLGMLLENLRRKTGFLEMQFDDAGFLNLGNRLKISGGSATARELLIAAVDRMRVIELECHDRSLQVAFARLARPISYISHATGARIEAFPVEIDFNDFRHLRGDKTVLAAFDFGFVVLHELAHAALGLHDSSDETSGPGECENYINRIRGELGLPERQNYVARTFINRGFPTGKSTQHAELFFARKGGQESQAKPQVLNLTWEAENVGVIKEGFVKSLSAAAKAQMPQAKSPAVVAP